MDTKKILVVLTLTLGTYSAYAVTPESTEAPSAMNSEYSKTTDTVQTTTTRSSSVSREADVELTRSLREKLMADDQLSTSAKNVKIITNKRSITLTGPVANRAEKVKLENMARSMAGKKKVYNRLTY